MQHRKWPLAVIFGALFAFGLTVNANSKPEKIWKITSLNWQPYSNAEIANQGSSIQRLREILKQHGVRLIVEFYPWERAQSKAKEAGYLGYFPAWPEEVSQGFISSEAIDWSNISVMTNTTTSITFSSIDDLFKRFNVGVISAYVYPKPITDAMIKYPHNVEKANNEMILLKKLSKGRTPVAITDPKVMMYIAKREAITNVTILKSLMTNKLVIALTDSAENRSRIKQLTEILASQ